MVIGNGSQSDVSVLPESPDVFGRSSKSRIIMANDWSHSQNARSIVPKLLTKSEG